MKLLHPCRVVPGSHSGYSGSKHRMIPGGAILRQQQNESLSCDLNSDARLSPYFYYTASSYRNGCSPHVRKPITALPLSSWHFTGDQTLVQFVGTMADTKPTAVSGPPTKRCVSASTAARAFDRFMCR